MKRSMTFAARTALSAAALFALGLTARAQTVYTNRAAFEAALVRHQTETFTAANNIYRNTSAAFRSLTVTAQTNSQFAVADNKLSIAAFPGTVSLKFPSPVTAFGGDFTNASNQKGVTITVGNVTYSSMDYLPVNGTGFFGIIAPNAFSSVSFDALPLVRVVRDDYRGDPVRRPEAYTVTSYTTFGLDDVIFRTVADPDSGRNIGSGSILAARDFNGDGTPDFLSQTDGKPAFWYTAPGNGTPRIASQGMTTDAPTGGWQVVGAGRFSQTGSPDLVLTHPTDRRIHFWHMNGAQRLGGEYAYYTNHPDQYMTLPQGASFLGTADFDGDGLDDIAWFDPSTRRIGIWIMHGASFYSGHYISQTLPRGWKIVAMGQMDASRSPELVLLSPSREVHVWSLNGFTWYNGAYVLDPADNSNVILPDGWEIVGLADFDHDGRSEIVMQNSSMGQIAYWKLTPNLYFYDSVTIPMP